MLGYMIVLEINSTAINQRSREKKKKGKCLDYIHIFFTSMYDRCYLQLMNIIKRTIERTKVKKVYRHI